jgi:transcriptional regulator with XRE-family HTH domain
VQTNPTPFGKLLKATLRKQDISTSEFSRRLKTPTSNLQNIESGRRSAGAEIVASILNELDLSESERELLLHAATEQSDAIKAGVEIGNWRIATQWWNMFGADAVQAMGFKLDCLNRQFCWRPVVHEKWLIRCHFQYPDVSVVLGYNAKKSQVEAAFKDYDRRTSTRLPTRATHWCKWKDGRLGPMIDDGTPIHGADIKNETQIQNPNKTQN